MKQKFTFCLVLISLLGSFAIVSRAQVLVNESFDSPVYPPAAWGLTGGGAGGYCASNWQYVPSGGPVCSGYTAYAPPPAAHSGAGMAGFDCYWGISANGQLVSPNMSFTIPGATYRISFWAFRNTTYASIDQLNIYATNSYPTLGTPIFNVLPNNTSGPQQWVNYVITIPATVTGSNCRVVIEAVPWIWCMYIDGVNVTAYTPCIGKPNSVISGPSSVCSGINFTLNDIPTSGLTGVTWQWQSSPAGTGNFTSIGGATNYTYTTNTTYAQDYRIISYCSNSGLYDTSAIHSISINSFYSCYCGPSLGGSLGGNTLTGYPFIDSVSISATSLHYRPFHPLTNAYAQFPATGNSTAGLQVGATYTITAALQQLGANCKAWLDFNTVNGFETTEFINMLTIPNTNMAVGSFTVPAGTPLGLTGLRIRSHQNAITSTDPCTAYTGTNGFGETQDYLVSIVPAPVNDLGATGVVQPALNSVICANTNFTVRAAIANMGSAAQTNFVIQADITGPSSVPSLLTTYAGSLPSYSTGPTFGKDTVVIGTVSLPLAGTYKITVRTGLVNDLNHLNDTAYGSVVVVGLPGNPVVTSDTVCYGDSATMSIAGVPGDIYNWYNAPFGGSVVYTGTSMTIDTLRNSTTYFVSASTPGIVDKIPGSVSAATGQLAQGGVFIEVNPIVNLAIDSFKLRFADTGLHIVNVWYRIGTNSSAQLTNSSAWILAASRAVHPANTTTAYTVDMNTPFMLTAGSVYGIYLEYDGLVLNGGATWTTAGVISVTSLYGLSSSFGGVTTNQKTMLGQVWYHTAGSDCESVRIPIAAVVGPAPQVNLGPDRQICWTPGLVLDAGNPGGTYMWASTTDTGMHATTKTIQIPHPGNNGSVMTTYTVIADRYCSDTDNVTLVVIPPPAIGGINYIRQGNTTYFFRPAGAENVLGYFWKFGDGATSTIDTPIHSYATNDPHHVQLIVYNTCGTDTVDWIVPLNIPYTSTGEGIITLYPNPANSSITIEAEHAQIEDLTIINTVGAVVYRSNGNKTNKEQVDISSLAPGHYILRASTTVGNYNKAFEVMH